MFPLRSAEGEGGAVSNATDSEVGERKEIDSKARSAAEPKVRICPKVNLLKPTLGAPKIAPLGPPPTELR